MAVHQRPREGRIRPGAAAGRYAHFSRTQISGPTIPAGLGEHTREVLTEIGYSPSEIEALDKAGVVRQGAPLDI
jgi:crotonobetainyl-CoA:carnitine CoA-transferase CaiB-like acyl-CoA transferase